MRIGSARTLVRDPSVEEFAAWPGNRPKVSCGSEETLHARFPFAPVPTSAAIGWLVRVVGASVIAATTAVVG